MHATSSKASYPDYSFAQSLKQAFFLLLVLALPTALRAQVRIMPLGNSITQGNTQHNSYRRALWFKLRNGGYNVDFVGSQNGNFGGTPPNPDFDLNSEGHWGWRADELLNNISGWAVTYQPDIVLMHAGSNDMLQGQSVESTLGEIGQLIDRLRAANPNVKILLSKLIPTTLAANGNITALNNALPGLANQKNTAQSSVTIVDQNTGFNAAAETFDGVHPTDAGEEKMAAKWYQALQPLLAATPQPVVALRAPENPANTTAGLQYSYYEGSWTQLPDFNSLAAVKTGVTELPTLGVRNREDNFAVRYTGFVDVPADGEYTFYTSSDDGSQLFIGSTLVVDNNGAHGTQERSGKIGLQKGKHAFTLTFFENTGDQVLTASYAGPGFGKTSLPASALFRTATATSPTTLRAPENPAATVAGLDYRYYEGSWLELPNFNALTPAKAGNSTTITLSLRNQEDNFAFRYTGFVDVPADGEYTFYTSSDDGSQLFIGSTLVVDNNGAHGTQERSGKIGLQKGKHAFTLTFFENTGDQVLTASYAGPGFGKTSLPASALFRTSTANDFVTNPVASFYRAINLNGPALSLDGNAWEGYNTANFSYAGNSYENQGVTLVPATDADRARMVRSFIWGSTPSVTLSAVPAGTYDVYAYVWEDNNPETFSIKVNNNLVLSNYRSGSAGAWQKLGPWRTTVTNGTLTLSTQGGDANLSGLEVWRAPAGSSAAKTAASSSAEPETKLSLYPNPSATQVYLGGAGDWSQVVVRDSYGRVHLTQDHCEATTPLNTSALPNGIYSVEARSATGQTLHSSLVVAH